MKRLRAVMSMICFAIGFIALLGGILAALATLVTFSANNMNPLHHQPFSDLVLTALPGVGAALVGVILLVCARSLDDRGPVRRYGRRKHA